MITNLAEDGGVGALDGAHDVPEVISVGSSSRGGCGALLRRVGEGRRGEARGEVVHGSAAQRLARSGAAWPSLLLYYSAALEIGDSPLYMRICQEGTDPRGQTGIGSKCRRNRRTGQPRARSHSRGPRSNRWKGTGRRGWVGLVGAGATGRMT
jgi:hypothetical protein